MEEIIDNVFVRATEFMHDSGLRMDSDHVGKPQDLYLWCSVDGGKDWGLWGCPMRFTIAYAASAQSLSSVSGFRN